MPHNTLLLACCNLEKVSAIWPNILEKISPTDFSKFCGLTTQNTSELYNHFSFPYSGFQQVQVLQVSVARSLPCSLLLRRPHSLSQGLQLCFPSEKQSLTRDLSWTTPLKSELPAMPALSSPLRLVNDSNNHHLINHPPFTSLRSENSASESVTARIRAVICIRMAPSRDRQREKNSKFKLKWKLPTSGNRHCY